jgi:adenylate cyclase
LYSPNTRKRLRRGLVLLTAGVILLFCILDGSGSLEWLENRTSDWRTLAAIDPRQADRDIVIIDIDNASFREITAQIGRWPWTRRLWTELLRYIAAGQPRMVLFDVIFSGSEPGADQGFASAIRAAGNVMLPFAFVSAAVDTATTSAPPQRAAVPVTGAAGHAELKKTEWSLNVPNETLAPGMAGSGSTLGNADRDGITRRLPLTVAYDGQNWATLWLAAAMKLNGATAARFQNGEFRSGPIRLPVDTKGNYIVRWHGTPQTAYQRIPLVQMVCSMQPEVCDASVTRHPASEFRGKIVFVGASAAGSYEVRPTAVSETAPGVFILTTALDNLLHNHALIRTPEALTFALVLILAVLPAFAVGASRSIIVPLGATFATTALYGGACFLLYTMGSVWLPMTAPILAGAVSFSASTVLRYFTVDRELSRTRGTLERYVSPQLVRYVMDNLESFHFDGEKRRLTVFFSDVRGFTTLTEKSDPVVLLKQLNEYLEAMTEIIFRYDGIVDKFIGDGIMAHWGAFTPDRPNAMLAARAALEMIETLGQLNQRWSAVGRPALEIGIGLNTAEVIFGNVGTGKKVDFTAIGDGVNLAARLESANKEYHTHIIISDATRQELGSAAEVRPLGSIIVKGKTVGVEIFELNGLLEKKKPAPIPRTGAGPIPDTPISMRGP